MGETCAPPISCPVIQFLRDRSNRSRLFHGYPYNSVTVTEFGWHRVFFKITAPKLAEDF